MCYKNKLSVSHLIKKEAHIAMGPYRILQLMPI